jgi:HEAT repeats
MQNEVTDKSARLISQVKCFEKWADDIYLPEDRFGEWECDYPDWSSLYEAVLNFIGECLFSEWSTEQLQAVLYALARDNDCQYIVKKISQGHPETLIELATVSINLGEPNAKWQLAAELGNIQSYEKQAEEILLDLVRDTDEYVRRRALIALARIKSEFVEDLALEIWHQSHESQEWARMAVLWSLYQVGSSALNPLLSEAELDSRPYLASYARKMRQSEVEP